MQYCRILKLTKVYCFDINHKLSTLTHICISSNFIATHKSPNTEILNQQHEKIEQIMHFSKIGWKMMHLLNVVIRNSVLQTNDTSSCYGDMHLSAAIVGLCHLSYIQRKED